ncbi:MAG: hypothetical protein U0797_17670 [Gemmataceae bacterium]
MRLKLGNRAGYAALCEAAVKELGAPIRTEGGLPLLLAAPEGARWLQEMDESDLVFASFNFVTFNYYAAQQYRLEEYRSARNALVRLTPGEPGDARNWFVRAMAEKKLGDVRSAKVSLAEGVKVLEASRAKPRDDGDTAFDGAGGWLDRVAEDLLRQEAEGLLKGK